MLLQTVVVAADAQQFWLLLDYGARFGESLSDVNYPFAAAERNECQQGWLAKNV